MLTGIVLILAGAALLTGSVLLARLHARLAESIGSTPVELRSLLIEAAPEVGTMMRLAEMLRPIGKICAGAGGLLALLGLYAFSLPIVPFWLKAMATVAFFGLLGIGIAIALVAKRLAPARKG